MDLNRNFIKKKIFFNENNRVDCFINIFLTKTCEIFEYVDVQKDEKIFKIDRQEINPYYIDFGFFDTIKRIKINSELNLTSTMIDYLNQNYSVSISNYSGYINPTISWFNEVGYNILLNDVTTTVDPVTNQTKKENGLEKLEKLQPITESLVSKSYFSPIIINK